MAGDELVQAYVKGALAGFQRVGLKAKEKRVVEIALPEAAASVTVGGMTVNR